MNDILLQVALNDASGGLGHLRELLKAIRQFLDGVELRILETLFQLTSTFLPLQAMAPHGALHGPHIYTKIYMTLVLYTEFHTYIYIYIYVYTYMFRLLYLISL